MLGRVPYSKAQIWQTILVSFLLVVFNTPSCPAAALAADEAAAKEDKREAPAAAPVEDYADAEGNTALNVFGICTTFVTEMNIIR